MSHNQLMQLIGPTGLGGLGECFCLFVFFKIPCSWLQYGPVITLFTDRWEFGVSKMFFLQGALAGPGLASLLGSGGPATSSSTSRYVWWFLNAYICCRVFSHLTASIPHPQLPQPIGSRHSVLWIHRTPQHHPGTHHTRNPCRHLHRLAHGDPHHPCSPDPLHTCGRTPVQHTAHPAEWPAEHPGHHERSRHGRRGTGRWETGNSCDLHPLLLSSNILPVAPSVVDLASVLTPDVMAPILANPEVQQRLLPYLPSGESVLQSADEIQNTLTSPQFQQVSRAQITQVLIRDALV